jgi:hypothetical protein
MPQRPAGGSGARATKRAYRLPVRLLAFALLVAACSSSPAPGSSPYTREVANCVAKPSNCPSGACLPQRDGRFLCACVGVPAGQTCEPCPAGYRYHGKYSACVETCAVIEPTCGAPKVCVEDFGVARCDCPVFSTGPACDTCTQGALKVDGRCRLRCDPATPGGCFGDNGRCEAHGADHVCVCNDPHAVGDCNACEPGWRQVDYHCAPATDAGA